jgi:hypothetical protein
MYWLILLFMLFPLNVFGAFSVSGVDDPASVAGVDEPASVGGVESDYTPACEWQYVAKNVQDGTGNEVNFDTSGGANKAISFVANGTYSPRRYTFRLKKHNSPTVTMQFAIRQDAGESTSRTEPGDVVISAVTYEAEDLTTSYDTHTVDVPEESTAELTNGNVYWFQIYGGNDSTNYVQWLYGPDGDEELDTTTAPPTTWTEYDTSVTGSFTIWSYECL